MDPLNSSSNISFFSLSPEVHGLIIDKLFLKDIFGTWKKVSKSFQAILEASLSKNESLQRKFTRCLPLYILLKDNNGRGSLLGKFNELGIPEKIPRDPSEYSLIENNGRGLLLGRFNELGVPEEISHDPSERTIDKAFQFKLEENKQGLWELVEITTAIDIIGQKVLAGAISEFNRDSIERVQRLAKPSDVLLRVLQNNSDRKLWGGFNSANIPEVINTLPGEEVKKIIQFTLEKEKGLWRIGLSNLEVKLTLEQREILKLTLDKLNKDSIEQVELAQPSDFLYNLMINKRIGRTIVGRFNELDEVEDITQMFFERSRYSTVDKSFSFQIEKGYKGIWQINETNLRERLTLKQRRIIELTLNKFNAQVQDN